MLQTLPMVNQPKQTLSSIYADHLETLSLHSTLAELPSYNKTVDVAHLTKVVVKLFEEDTLIPGVILKRNGLFYGMISRRRFLKRMSRPYALEIFLKRPLSTLYNVENFPVNILPEHTPILDAAQFVLERQEGQMYEPVVIETQEGGYSLIDVPLLLYAQSHIHQLTSQLLKEQTHAQRVQTEKMASLGRMVAGIAHELRNPVNCIHGNMDFLRDYFGDLLRLVEGLQREIPEPSPAIAALLEEVELDFLQEDLGKILESIAISSVRMTEIVTSLRNFSRVDERKQELINLPECIESTLLILNNRTKKKDITIFRDYDSDLPEILGYSGQLSQVFLNLFANALDAIEEKQAGNPETVWEPQIAVKITTLKNQNGDRPWICVQIQDNADGIPAEVQQQIFQDFFTTKPLGKGTGLGLAISHEIITQKHGGKIELDSQPGIGSTFAIWLPAHSDDFVVPENQALN